MKRVSLALAAALLAFSAILPSDLSAQVLPRGAVTGGVQLSPEGTLSARTTTAQLPKPDKADKQTLTYVSLPRLLEKFQASLASKEKISPELRTLGGLTRIDFIYVYPNEKDLVLAGPAEPLDFSNPLQPVGKISRRPALQLDDLLVALRAVNSKTADFYGCSLDIVPNSQSISDDVVKKFGSGPRPKLIEEMKKAIGPQTVRVIGVPEDSRVALAMLAADYRLKRLSLGAEKAPIEGLASAVADAAGASRLWFAPNYESLLVSEAGDAYAIRGPRLKVECGAQMFEAKGASPAAERFAKTFTEKMPQLAEKVDGFADLQNIADLFLLAALIKTDKLDAKAGIDLSWALNPDNYAPEKLPTPKSADTVVHITGTSIASGGVSLSTSQSLKNRSPDTAKSIPAPNRPTDTWLLNTPLQK